MNLMAWFYVICSIAAREFSRFPAPCGWPPRSLRGRGAGLLRFFCVSAMHHLRVLPEHALRKALRVAVVGRALGPGVAIGVERNSFYAQPSAPLPELGRPVGFPQQFRGKMDRAGLRPGLSRIRRA